MAVTQRRRKTNLSAIKPKTFPKAGNFIRFFDEIRVQKRPFLTFCFWFFFHSFSFCFLGFPSFGGSSPQSQVKNPGEVGKFVLKTKKEKKEKKKKKKPGNPLFNGHNGLIIQNFVPPRPKAIKKS